MASTASRVLPVPAGPVSVRRRTSASPSSARISRCSLLRPTNEVDRARSLGAGRGVRSHSSDVQLRILIEDRPLEAAQRRPRLDPELLDQRGPRRPVGVQRLRLPARAVEREHELATQALRQRVLGDQALELADELVVRGRARDPRRCDPGARRGEAPPAGRSHPAPTTRRRTRPAAGRAKARGPRAGSGLRPAARPRAPRSRDARSGADRGHQARRGARSRPAA